MKACIHRRAAAALAALAIATASGPLAAGDDTVSGDKGAEMVVDLVVMRPLGVAATVIGAAAFVVALPFTIPSGSVESAGRELVAKPAEYTFNRPLGDFHHCGADRHPCGAGSRF